MFFRPLFLFGLVLLFLTSCETEPGQQAQPDNAERPAATTDTSKTVARTQYSEEAVTGQTLYVPVYSHIYQHNRAKTFNLTATLSIRNTSMQDSLEVLTVEYYDSNGNLVRTYLNQIQTLGPLSSIAYVIDEDDLTGGIGANFIVKWSARTPISDPIIEAVMISTSGQQGISFTGTARVIEEY